MSEIFIDWSKAPEGTTHIDLVTGNWEQHNSERVYRWIKNGNYWAKVFGGRYSNDTMRKRRAKPANVAAQPKPVTDENNVTGYEQLRNVLERAYDQASKGKGAVRHGKDLPFHLQPMQQIGDMYGIGFMLGQVAKKIEEAQRLPRERAVAEILGAINYCAGAVIFLEKQADE